MEENPHKPLAQSNFHKYLFTVTTLSKLLAMFLFIILPFAGFYAGMKYQEKISVTSTLETEKPNTTPSPIPTAMPTISTSPTMPTIKNNTLPTPTPKAATGNINVTFAEWVDGTGANSENSPDNETTYIHIGGNGIDRTFKGSPNWSSSFNPGTYDVNGNASFGAFMFQRCKGDGCGEESNGNVKNCGFQVKLKAGSSVNLTCWYKK